MVHFGSRVALYLSRGQEERCNMGLVYVVLGSIPCFCERGADVNGGIVVRKEDVSGGDSQTCFAL